jgi:hypothetical protein
MQIWLLIIGVVTDAVNEEVLIELTENLRLPCEQILSIEWVKSIAEDLW